MFPFSSFTVLDLVEERMVTLRSLSVKLLKTQTGFFFSFHETSKHSAETVRTFTLIFRILT